MLKILKPRRIIPSPDDEVILAGIFLTSILFPIAMVEGDYNSRPQIVEETNERVVFQPSTEFNQGRVRAYDFDKDGLLDKVESASFSYRPAHLAWHNVDRTSSFFRGIQKEYSDLLSSKDYQRAKQYDKKVRDNWRKLIGR